VASYVREGELCQVFYFDLLQQPFEAPAFRTSIASSLDGLAGLGPGAGVPTWTLNSHDVHRSVSRYGLVEPEPLTTADLNATRTRARGGVDLALGAARARAALLLTLALPGSVYLYQGEELGLPEFQDIPADARRDPIWERSGRTEHGRDGSRVPLPWSAGTTSFGFSPPGADRPWLPQPDWFGQFAADGQDDPQSMLAFYRLALGARAAVDPASALEWLETGRDDVLAFRRGRTVSVTVFAGPPYAPPTDWGHLVLRSDLGAADAVLPANSTGWLHHP
jgi:alpha-glucosidase